MPIRAMLSGRAMCAAARSSTSCALRRDTTPTIGAPRTPSISARAAAIAAASDRCGGHAEIAHAVLECGARRTAHGDAMAGRDLAARQLEDHARLPRGMTFAAQVEDRERRAIAHRRSRPASRMAVDIAGSG